MVRLRVEVPKERIARFCDQWMITELALFGSVLRDDFREDSDVDVLATFSPAARWNLFDFAEMREELTRIFGREVDLVSRRGLEASRNYLRRRAILSSTETIHVAG